MAIDRCDARHKIQHIMDPKPKAVPSSGFIGLWSFIIVAMQGPKHVMSGTDDTVPIFPTQ